jgi:predicted metal-dependent phosphoesterase TrpH
MAITSSGSSRFADLHTHTYHSDGTRSPREVIDVARAHGIEIVAISDHDNIAAFHEIDGYAREQNVMLVPATELSCGYKGVDIHVLAYAFDPHDETIEQRLRGFREARHRRGLTMVERLQARGFAITAARVEELAAGAAMGRPHVARALVESGYASTVADAFDRLIGTGKDGYVEKERFDIDEAVTMVKGAGGVTSIAHPTLYPNGEVIVAELFERGVDAVEVMHPEISPGARRIYSDLAARHGKFTTGGSDDHGTVKTAQTLGTVKVPQSMIEEIVKRME